MIASAKRAFNELLKSVGFQIVRNESLDRLQNAAREAASKEDEALWLIDEAFKSSVAANIFRLTPTEGEPTDSVSRAALKSLLRESAALRKQGDELVNLRRTLEVLSAGQDKPEQVHDDLKPADHELYNAVYNYNGLRTDPYIVHNHDFMRDSRFVAAYKRALQTTPLDNRYYWRAHVALWCSSIASRLEGDFVECGVWKGFLSTAIASYLDWNNIGKKFFLFDTFRGLDERQLTDEEINNITHFRIGYGEDIYDHVVRNFSEFRNIEIVRGPVPHTLPKKNIGKVAYLSIDMNNAAPEIAAADYFWDRLSPGAPILLDDYGFVRYEVQKRAFDEFAAARGVEILALPTGQGLMIKPPS